jgi:uncharacterized phage protein gp47/JayE
MSSFGVLSTGFVAKDLDTVKTEIEAYLRGTFGAGINLLSETVFGQLVGLMSEREWLLWQMGQGVYASQYANTATGQALDNIMALTGVVRLQPSKSAVTLTCNLDAGVTLAAGQIVSPPAHPDVKFVTTASGTNSGGTPANVSIAAECSVTGPVQAVSGALTVIVTPQTGWNSVTNALDAVVGRDLELDAAARVRRTAALATAGSSPVDSLRARLLGVTNVAQAYVFENATDVTDGAGVTPHAIEACVEGGTNADIAASIWANKPAGTGTVGTTTVSVTDSQGFAHDVKFTRPSDLSIYVGVTVTVDAAFPVDGDTQIKDLIVAHGDTYLIGQDVIANQFYRDVYQVSGVVECSAILIGTTYPPVASTTIVVGSRQLAVFDTSRITVAHA